MWQDMVLLMGSEAELHRQSLQLSPGVRFRSLSSEARVRSASEEYKEDDKSMATRHENVFLQKLVLRIILGAISATLFGLTIVATPLLLCKAGLMQWLGVLMGSYELMFLFNAIVMVPWVLTKRAGIRQLLPWAAIFALLGQVMLFISVFLDANLLFFVVPAVGVSTSLQSSLLTGLNGDNPDDDYDSDQEEESPRPHMTITSDVLFFQYITLFGPALGILCGLSGPRVAPVLVAVDVCVCDRGSRPDISRRARNENAHWHGFEYYHRPLS